MELQIMNAGGLNGLVSGLGGRIEGQYVVSDDCVENLEDLLEQLQDDDPVQHTFRRQIATSKVVTKDIVPLMSDAGEDVGVMRSALKLLANLTQPIECLQKGSFNQTEESDEKKEEWLPWIRDVQKMLVETKKACANLKFVHSLITYLKSVLAEVGDFVMKEDECDTIHQSFLVLRNLLHVQDGDNSIEGVVSSSHVTFLKFLFSHGIDEVLLQVLNRQERDVWGFTVIQMISLLYRDMVGQIFQTLEDTSSCGEESCDSDSSQCETAIERKIASTPEQDSGNQSQDLAEQSQEDSGTYDGSQDQSQCSKDSGQPSSTEEKSPQNEVQTKTHRTLTTSHSCESRPLAKSFRATCTIGVQASQTSSSDSSESACDVCTQNNANRQCCLMQTTYGSSQQPSVKLECLGTTMMHFTTQFLQSGFSSMVQILKNGIMSDSASKLDHSYFLWTVAFFLKFARRKEIDFKDIRDVFTPEVFGFLVYEAMYNDEQVLIQFWDNKPYALNARRLHLSVSALRELFKTLFFHRDRGLNEVDSQYIEHLQRKLAMMSDLRQLFMWLIRHHVPGCHSNLFLRDVIVTNHYYLLLLEYWLGQGYGNANFTMLDHVQQFATRPMMRKYGDLLQHFKKNDAHVNDCIFTMMHHVAGDCGQVQALLQVAILKTFLEIWDKDFPITQEINDLMEYVIQRFMSSAEDNPLSFAVHLFLENQSDVDMANGMSTKEEMPVWTAEEEDKLIMWYSEYQGEADILELIKQQFSNIGIEKTKLEIVNQLSELGWLSPDEVEALMPSNPSQANLIDNKIMASEEAEGEEAGVLSFLPNEGAFELVMEELTSLEEEEILPHCIRNVADPDCIAWLQSCLLELAYIKLDSGEVEKRSVEEPVARVFAVQGLDVPLISYSDRQEGYQQDVYFYLIQQQLGISMPDATGFLFPRVPAHFSCHDLILKAEALGSLSNVVMKFDLSIMKKIEMAVTSDIFQGKRHPQESTQSAQQLARKRATQMPSVMWMNMVKHFNSHHGYDSRHLEEDESMEGME